MRTSTVVTLALCITVACFFATAVNGFPTEQLGGDESLDRNARHWGYGGGWGHGYGSGYGGGWGRPWGGYGGYRRPYWG
jgi:hypothetical protein